MPLRQTTLVATPTNLNRLTLQLATFFNIARRLGNFHGRKPIRSPCLLSIFATFSMNFSDQYLMSNSLEELLIFNRHILCQGKFVRVLIVCIRYLSIC